MGRHGADHVKACGTRVPRRPRPRPACWRRSPAPTPSSSVRRTRWCRSGRSSRCRASATRSRRRRDVSAGVCGIVGGRARRRDGRPADAGGGPRGLGGRRRRGVRRAAGGLGDRRARPRPGAAHRGRRAAGRRDRHDHDGRRPRRGARPGGAGRWRSHERGGHRARRASRSAPGRRPCRACSRRSLHGGGTADGRRRRRDVRRSCPRRRDGWCPAPTARDAVDGGDPARGGAPRRPGDRGDARTGSSARTPASTRRTWRPGRWRCCRRTPTRSRPRAARRAGPRRWASTSAS